MYFSLGWGVECAVASDMRVFGWPRTPCRVLQPPSQSVHFKKPRDGKGTSARPGRSLSGPHSRVLFTERRWDRSVSVKWTHSALRHVCFHVPEGQTMILWKSRGMGVSTSEEGVYVWLTGNSGTYFWDTAWDDDQVRAINLHITLAICPSLVTFWNTHPENCISLSLAIICGSAPRTHAPPCSWKASCQCCHHHGQCVDSQGTFIASKHKK